VVLLLLQRAWVGGPIGSFCGARAECERWGAGLGRKLGRVRVVLVERAAGP
jgi:hypothetical protein